MGREVRRVPKYWRHPKRNGNFIPLLIGYAERVAAWDLENSKWAEGFKRSGDGWEPRDGSENCMYFSEWDGERPVTEDYMPDFAPGSATHLMMYETCSEGTPISPAFATPEELARWCADNGASVFGGMTTSYEGWLRIARGGCACSAIITGGAITSGVDGLTEDGD